jgi:PEP-CTERM motif
MINTLLLTAIVAVTASASTITASSASGDTPGDPFDISRGVVVTSSSPVIDFYDIRNIFGGNFGHGGEPGNALFKDMNSNPWPVSNNLADYFVTFSVTRSLSGYRLFLEDDFNGTANRTVSRFRLFQTGNTTPLSDVTILDQGQMNYLTTWGSDSIALSDSFNPVRGGSFTAVFTSNSLANPTAQGPRVVEFDGIDPPATSTPEPSTLLLLSMGLLGLLFTRKTELRSMRRTGRGERLYKTTP